MRLTERSQDLNKYRRIEVKAFRHRVNIVSGEWSREISEAVPPQTDDEVLVNDSDLCEPVRPSVLWNAGYRPKRARRFATRR